ncbi:MAG: succinate dehydrogenase, hydrophobic membrane anchor protein [Pseudomonadota bacterium]|nr:succinate dehydrogenase, hydrophobic membrane anchor protein [Pseudomonadota bacterium]
MKVKKNNLEVYKKKNSNGALNHWITQKISALILLPLLWWFLFIFKDFINKDYSSQILWMKNFSNSLLLTLFIIIALFHLRLGLTVVIEDYIHNLKSKNFLLSLITILCLLFSVFTVIVIYMISVKSDV